MGTNCVNGDADADKKESASQVIVPGAFSCDATNPVGWRNYRDRLTCSNFTFVLVYQFDRAYRRR